MKKSINTPIKLGHGLNRAAKLIKRKFSLVRKSPKTFKHEKKWVEDRLEEN